MEAKIRAVTNRVNEALKELGARASDDDAHSAIEALLPDGWEWIEATQINGFREIAITRLPQGVSGD